MLAAVHSTGAPGRIVVVEEEDQTSKLQESGRMCLAKVFEEFGKPC